MPPGVRQRDRHALEAEPSEVRHANAPEHWVSLRATPTQAANHRAVRHVRSIEMGSAMVFSRPKTML
ncbi:MAG TPA: hypothetical protein VH519_16150 [Hyphomicrobiaceae bacterium]|jgi:hypothetical protein